ncbi:hypothetical protein IP88_15795 [alpha proteobacterium AAP81b]|nr:hypothetical protein IP88_15795 [alpha proteobacterium AAP81b]
MAERDPRPFNADPAAYDHDVRAWALAQAALLRDRRFDALDIANIAEEIESLGNEQAHAVESHLIVLVEHLLKLTVSADVEPRRGWRLSVLNARSGISRRLRKNPSLRRQLPEMFAENWSDARQSAIGDLREAEEALVPAEPPFTLAQVLDPAFFPGG